MPDTLDVGAFSPKGLQIAWCMMPSGSNTCEEVASALSSLKAILGNAGATITETEPDLAGLHQAQADLRSFGMLLHHEKTISARPELFSPEIRKSLERGMSLTKTDLVNAIRIRDHAVETISAFFDEFDVMVWPASAQLPFDAEAKSDEILEDWTPIELTPVLQIPALSVPVNITPDGMPCGVQFIGPKRSDLKLVELARILEPEIGFVGQYSASCGA